MLYDAAVIGKGLFGTAAAKYLQAAGLNTILIGPDEPQESEYKNATVFASHYDAGRVTRLYGQTKEWTELNRITQNNFAEIKEKSGIDFYETEGSLFVSTEQNRKHYDEVINNEIKDGDSNVEILDANELKQKFPLFNFPLDALCYFEKGNSGHLKPRKLIEAQIRIFTERGGSIATQLATKIEHAQNHHLICTNEGAKIKANKVLICTGAFHNFFEFNTEPAPLILKSETILLAELDAQTALQLQTLPSLIYDITTNDYDEIYLVKPLLYPDGKYYLKLGANLSSDKYFTSLNEVKDWFCSNSSLVHQKLYEDIFKDLFPALVPLSFKTKHCIIERTISKKPFLKGNGNNIFTCTGGNGYGAMCSDAVGKMAAEMVMAG